MRRSLGKAALVGFATFVLSGAAAAASPRFVKAASRLVPASPRCSSSTNPAALHPAIAPAVLTKYSTPVPRCIPPP